MKALIRRLTKYFNLLLADRSRIGIEMENDILRLSHENPVRTILDIGANHGQSALRFAREFPGAEIYSFEPVPDNFKILSARCSRHARIELIPKGLGRVAADVDIGLSDNPGGNSILLGASAQRTVIISLSTLDSFVEERQLKKIDLLKIDVEGLEMDVLEGATKSFSEGRIRFVYAECIFEPDASSPHTLLSDLSAFLVKYGLALFACYHESFSLRAGSAMGNVLFANKALLPNSVPGKVRNIF